MDSRSNQRFRQGTPASPGDRAEQVKSPIQDPWPLRWRMKGHGLEYHRLAGVLTEKAKLLGIQEVLPKFGLSEAFSACQNGTVSRQRIRFVDDGHTECSTSPFRPPGTQDASHAKMLALPVILASPKGTAEALEAKLRFPGLCMWRYGVRLGGIMRVPPRNTPRPTSTKRLRQSTSKR